MSNTFFQRGSEKFCREASFGPGVEPAELFEIVENGEIFASPTRAVAPVSLAAA